MISYTWRTRAALAAWRVLAMAACVVATLLASSRIEQCVSSSSSGPMSCAQRFVVTLTAQNGVNASESLVAASVSSARDSGGALYDLEEELEISVSKSSIQLQYPLTYVRAFNARPSEVVRTADLSGRSFNYLTNPCMDDPARDGACGWVVAGGVRVPNSNGFCCRCDVDRYFGGGGSASRAGLDCNLLDASNSQSAHCLRMSPLWYSAFAIGPHRVHYTLDVVFKRCTRVVTPGPGAGGNGSSSTGSSSSPGPSPSSLRQQCVYQLAKLSPTSPGVCRDFPSLSSPGSSSSPSNTTACDAWVSLVGDFAAFEAAPDYSGKLLMVPQVCEDFAACGNRTLDPPERWMLVDLHATTSGAECNKVGVAYSGFQGQGSRCEVPVGSCLKNQLDDLYAADAAADASGGVGEHWVKFHTDGGTFIPSLTSASSARMSFVTTRFQQSVVTIYVNADRIQHRQRVVAALVTAVYVSQFEAMSRAGRLVLTVSNTADIDGLVTVVVECGEGIDPVPAQQLSLGHVGTAGASRNATFSLYTQSTTGATYGCVVTVQNALFRTTDSRGFLVNTSATKLRAGEQGGSPAPGSPIFGTAPSARPSSSCEDRCPNAWDPVCALLNRCTDRIVGWAGSIGGLVLMAGLLAKFPFLLTSPLKWAGMGAFTVLRLLGCMSSSPSSSSSAPPSSSGRGQRRGEGRRGHGGRRQPRPRRHADGEEEDSDGGNDDNRGSGRRRRRDRASEGHSESPRSDDGATFSRGTSTMERGRSSRDDEPAPASARGGRGSNTGKAGGYVVRKANPAAGRRRGSPSARSACAGGPGRPSAAVGHGREVGHTSEPSRPLNARAGDHDVPAGPVVTTPAALQLDATMLLMTQVVSAIHQQLGLLASASRMQTATPAAAESPEEPTAAVDVRPPA